mmetsp:Transcript_14132/g.19626  ORF Transcript_14132/g.19626 Transcript_14132/m.19626 type:complete len:84 (+) Transcript_14132:965-1216(+)
MMLESESILKGWKSLRMVMWSFISLLPQVFLIATGVLILACGISATLPKTAPEITEVPDAQWQTTPTATDAAAAAGVVNDNGY